MMNKKLFSESRLVYFAGGADSGQSTEKHENPLAKLERMDSNFSKMKVTRETIDQEASQAEAKIRKMEGGRSEKTKLLNNLRELKDALESKVRAAEAGHEMDDDFRETDELKSLAEQAESDRDFNGEILKDAIGQERDKAVRNIDATLLSLMLKKDGDAELKRDLNNMKGEMQALDANPPLVNLKDIKQWFEKTRKVIASVQENGDRNRDVLLRADARFTAREKKESAVKKLESFAAEAFFKKDFQLVKDLTAMISELKNSPEPMQGSSREAWVAYGNGVADFEQKSEQYYAERNKDYDIKKADLETQEKLSAEAEEKIKDLSKEVTRGFFTSTRSKAIESAATQAGKDLDALKTELRANPPEAGKTTQKFYKDISNKAEQAYAKLKNTMDIQKVADTGGRETASVLKKYMTSGFNSYAEFATAIDEAGKQDLKGLTVGDYDAKDTEKDKMHASLTKKLKTLKGDIKLQFDLRDKIGNSASGALESTNQTVNDVLGFFAKTGEAVSGLSKAAEEFEKNAQETTMVNGFKERMQAIINKIQNRKDPAGKSLLKSLRNGVSMNAEELKKLSGPAGLSLEEYLNKIEHAAISAASKPIAYRKKAPAKDKAAELLDKTIRHVEDAEAKRKRLEIEDKKIQEAEANDD